MSWKGVLAFIALLLLYHGVGYMPSRAKNWIFLGTTIFAVACFFLAFYLDRWGKAAHKADLSQPASRIGSKEKSDGLAPTPTRSRLNFWLDNLLGMVAVLGPMFLVNSFGAATKDPDMAITWYHLLAMIIGAIFYMSVRKKIFGETIE